MPIFRDPRRGWLKRLVAELDLLYLVPVVIAVAAFIIAVMSYFRGMN